MKNIKSSVSFFMLFLVTLIPINASADVFGTDDETWERVFVDLKKINSRLVRLETSEIGSLRHQLEDLLRQIEEIKQSVPQLQNAVELNKLDTLTAVELNKSDTLAEVNKLETKINDLQAEVKNQVLFKISQQNKILNNIREDQKKLKLGLAQDLEKFEKLNKENFQTFALGNKSNLEKIAQKLDSLEETTIKNFEGTKGLFISQLIPTIKDNQAKVHDDLLASRKTNDKALKRLSDENQKLSKELSSILRENLIQGIDTKNQVESIDKNVAAASQNIAVNNKNLMIADEKINKLAETMKSLQVQHFASSATLEALKKDLAKAQEFDQLADEKINKLIKNSAQLTVHANQLEKTVINELQQSLNKADSSQDKINLANERLTLLIEILKAIAKEQDKLAQAVKVRSGLNKAQAGLIKNQESIKEALADLRRKANLSLSKSDNIKKTLGAMKKK